MHPLRTSQRRGYERRQKQGDLNEYPLPFVMHGSSPVSGSEK